MRELSDPETGYSALVVGTAHVSGLAAEEVKRLLEDRPVEFCAVELDRERLEQAVAKLRRLETGETSSAYPLPNTTWKALKLMYSKNGGPSRVFYILSDSFSSSLLGVPYGVDMLTAVSEASKLGIPVVPIDRSSRITIARCMSQSKHFIAMRKRIEEQQEMAAAQAKDPELDQLQELAKEDPQMRRRVMMRKMRNVFRDVAEVVGCHEPDKAVDALANTVHSAMDDQEVSPEDLRTVRECGTRVVEFMRQLAESGATEKDADKLSSGPKEKTDIVRRMISMVIDGAGPPALSAERDLILAQHLRLCTARGPTLAVVGAAHVPGIALRWPEALSPAALEESKKYYVVPGQRPSPDSSSTPVLEDYTTQALDGKDVGWYAPSTSVKTTWQVPAGPVVVGLGLGLLGYYRPRAAAILGASFLTMVAAGNYVVASNIASVGRAAGRLEEASRKLAIEGSAEDFLH